MLQDNEFIKRIYLFGVKVTELTRFMSVNARTTWDGT